MKKIINYLIMILLFILSGTPYGTQYYMLLTIVSSVIIFICYLIYGKKKGKYEFEKSQFALFILFICLLFINITVNWDYDYQHYIGIVLTLIIGFLTTQIMDESTFVEIFIKLMIIICTYSLLIYAYSLINKSFISNLPYLFDDNIMWKNFNYIYISWGYGEDLFLRNSACFREPGVFGVYLVMALLFMSNRPFNKKNIKIITLLTIASISTFSTATIISVAMIFIGIIIINNNRITRKKLTIIISSLPILTFIITKFLSEYGEQLFSKFSPNSGSFSSFADRFYGMIIDIGIWLEGMILGVGYTKYTLMTSGTTNSFTSNMAKYGVIFIIIISFGFFYEFMKGSNNKLMNLIISLIIIIMFSTQAIIIMPFFITLIFIGYKNIRMVY